MRWTLCWWAFAMAAPTLTACGGSGEPPIAANLPDSADQVAWDVVHQITVDGILRVKLYSDTVFFYQASQSADLRGVTVEFYSAEGKLSSTVRSREGTYEWRTQAMEARGDVVGTSPDGRRLDTSILRYDRVKDQVSGPNAFMIDGPDSHLEGDGFTANPDLTEIVAVRPRSGRAEANSPALQNPRR